MKNPNAKYKASSVLRRSRRLLIFPGWGAQHHAYTANVINANDQSIAFRGRVKWATKESAIKEAQVKIAELSQ